MDPKFESVDLEEELLRAGREVRMSPELRNRTLAALGVGAIGLTATATAKAGTLASLAQKPGMLFGAGLVGALGVVGAVAGGWLEEERTTPPAESVAVLPGEAPASSEVTQPPETSPTETDEQPAEVPEAAPETDAPAPKEPPAATTRAEAPRKEGQDKSRGAAPASEATSLGDEVAQLGRAEAALRGGRPQDALSYLAEYRERFPRPRLGLEAEVLTIQALAESGSTAAARARAARFLERHPTSPLGARVKRYVE